MNQDLEQLKKLIDDSFEPSARQEIADLEKSLHYEIVKENFTSNSVVAEYMELLASDITNCKAQLSEQEDLPDRDRLKLFARIRASKAFLSHFTGKREQIEQTIKETLNDVTRQA